jgi:uncharacterized membrane protein YvbJ
MTYNDIQKSCPLCGFQNSQADSCARCGLIFDKDPKVRFKKKVINLDRQLGSTRLLMKKKKHEGLTLITAMIVMISTFFWSI